MKKKVLFLGASGLIGPFLTPGLENDYDLYLADVKPHPDGVSIDHVNVTSYEQVHEAVLHLTQSVWPRICSLVEGLEHGLSMPHPWSSILLGKALSNPNVHVRKFAAVELIQRDFPLSEKLLDNSRFRFRAEKAVEWNEISPAGSFHRKSADFPEIRTSDHVISTISIRHRQET